MIIICDDTNKSSKIFHLMTRNTSYVMAVVKEKYLAHVYWGNKIKTPDIDNAVVLRGVAFSSCPDLGDETYSLECLSQEFPTGDDTDYRIPAIQAVYSDGSRSIDLFYVGYEIYKGKKKPAGLPSVYAENETEAETLEITLEDACKGLKVILSYTVFEDYDAITRNVRIVNAGEERIVIERVMSASVDMDGSDFDFVHLYGAWARERHIARTPLRAGLQSIESRRGASSHQQNPFFAIAEKNAGEENGRVWGFNLVYSGNFEAGAEVDQMFCTRAYIGINGYDFSWILERGEEFTAPEAVMIYSNGGFGEMSRRYHRLYRERLVRGKYRDESRPILVNSWEAAYFDFDEEKILNLAKEAADLGIELLVLDDGWFGKRDDDKTSLGDWVVNRKKLPDGIDGLARKVNDLGLKFGLWFEPEMVSPDSELYREHPDWCIHIPGRTRTLCRRQLTLDLSRDEVCDYVIKAVSDVLASAPISYVKWDMNRHITRPGSIGLTPDRQKEMHHRYILGLYRVMEKITESFPDVLFESCSGGGGRFDPGILYYMPQTWTSDDTDAIERLYIQYGTSLVYPVSSMGAHVSAVPNHQLGRVTPLKTRGDVAMSGNFGYELDLGKLTAQEKEQVKKQVEQYKELRTFIQSGDMYRLKNPFEGNAAAWMFISKDKKDIFAAYFRINAVPNGPVERFKLSNLEKYAMYEVSEDGKDTTRTYSGGELMNIGLRADMWGDFTSKTLRIRKI